MKLKVASPGFVPEYSLHATRSQAVQFLPCARTLDGARLMRQCCVKYKSPGAIDDPAHKLGFSTDHGVDKIKPAGPWNRFSRVVVSIIRPEIPWLVSSSSMTSSASVQDSCAISHPPSGGSTTRAGASLDVAHR